MILSDTRKVGPFAGDGSTTVFPFTFKVFKQTDVAVFLTDAAGVEVQLTSGFSVQLNTNQDSAPGGQVVTTTPLVLGNRLTITSSVPATQPMQITNGGGFFPKVLNDSADRAMILIQQLQERISRTLAAPVSSLEPVNGLQLPSATARAGKLLAFDANGALVPVSSAAGGPGDTGLRTDLATGTGGNLIGYLAAAAGAIVRPLLDKLRDQISPYDYMPLGVRLAVAAGTNTNNLAPYINAAATDARTRRRKIDLLGAPGWLIKSEVDISGIVIEASFNAPIVVDVTGTYPRGYAVTSGDPTVAGGLGRAGGTVVLGNLALVATGRGTACNGIYMKGSYLTVGTVFAFGFKGCGVKLDSVWDSIYGRVVTDQCGSATRYAIELDSNGDTQNCTTITSLQCESAFQRGISANLLRYLVENIHSERLSVLTAGDINHFFLLSNSDVIQAVLDARNPAVAGDAGKAPDGTALATAVMNITLSGDESGFREIHASGHDVTCNYGTGLEFVNLQCRNYTQTSNASRVRLVTPNIAGTITAERELTVVGGFANAIFPSFNARDLKFSGVLLGTALDFTNVFGNIVFEDMAIPNVIGSGAIQSGYRATQFHRCTFAAFTGKSGHAPGVYHSNVTLSQFATGAATRFFFSYLIGNFTTAGGWNYLTIGCTGSTPTPGWAAPTNPYPLGTITERVGFEGGSATPVRYRNIAEPPAAPNWQAA